MRFEELAILPTYKYYDALEPLYKVAAQDYGFTFFYYERRVDGIAKLCLSSDKAWGVRYRTEYEQVDSFYQEKISQGFKYNVWGIEPKSKKEAQMHDERTHFFSIPSGISMAKNNGNYIDTFSVTSNRVAGNPVDFLISNLKSLEKFGQFFVKAITPFLQEHNLLSNQDKDEVDIFAISDRELQIILLLAKGIKLKSIAQELNIEPRTVQTHLDNAKKKLRCNTREQLVATVVASEIETKDLIVSKSIESIIVESGKIEKFCTNDLANMRNDN